MDPVNENHMVNTMTFDRPDYLVVDPLSADRHRPNSTGGTRSPTKQSKSTVSPRKAPDTLQPPKQRATYANDSRPFDLSENDARLLGARYHPEPDFMGPPGSPTNLNSWDWLRLDALGPGWDHALRDVPVTRKEALNLLIIMKKKLLRAANELNFYKERVTVLQEQLIYQKKMEEKFIKLRALFKAQLEELQILRDKVAKVPDLERTIRQQEELITRLETFLDRQRHRHVNTNLDRRLIDIDPFDRTLLDRIPRTPSLSPIRGSGNNSQHTGGESTHGAALRNLSQENEDLRQTVIELNKAVRNLVDQQQEDQQRQKRMEERYKEEVQGLREYQDRLAEQQFVQNKQLEATENRARDFVVNDEKAELQRMLEAAQSRVRNLEEHLVNRDRRTNVLETENTQYNRKPRDQYWKHPGQDRAVSRLPPVIGARERPRGSRFTSNMSDPGLERTRAPSILDWLSDEEDDF